MTLCSVVAVLNKSMYNHIGKNPKNHEKYVSEPWNIKYSKIYQIDSLYHLISKLSKYIRSIQSFAEPSPSCRGQASLRTAPQCRRTRWGHKSLVLQRMPSSPVGRSCATSAIRLSGDPAIRVASGCPWSSRITNHSLLNQCLAAKSS